VLVVLAWCRFGGLGGLGQIHQNKKINIKEILDKQGNNKEEWKDRHALKTGQNKTEQSKTAQDNPRQDWTKQPSNTRKN
jgi:hypothetical protein